MPRPTAVRVNESPIVTDITRAILLVRGQKVLLDVDLATLYGVSTKRLNEQVKRNSRRFPPDFRFRLATQETAVLRRSQFATASGRFRNPRFAPYVFTEHGALMAAMVLNSEQAVDMSVFVVRAFVRLRQLLLENGELSQKIAELERRVQGHDSELRRVVSAIRELATAPEPHGRSIGFLADIA